MLTLLLSTPRMVRYAEAVRLRQHVCAGDAVAEKATGAARDELDVSVRMLGM